MKKRGIRFSTVITRSPGAQSGPAGVAARPADPGTGSIATQAFLPRGQLAQRGVLRSLLALGIAVDLDQMRPDQMRLDQMRGGGVIETKAGATQVWPLLANTPMSI